MENISSPRRLAVAFLLTVALTAACSDGPLRLTQPPPSPAPPPSISSITGDMGSIGGGASMVIVGTGFQAGVVVLFDDVAVVPRFDSRDTLRTTMYLETPPHAAGAVDIVVRNPDGQSTRNAGAHTYVPPETFDPNGTWIGGTFDGSHRDMKVVIQNGRVVRVQCFGGLPSAELTVSGSTVVGGAFTVSLDDHEIVAGRMVAAREMIGTMNFSDCAPQMYWRAGPRMAQNRAR